jgi:DNA-binding transcriptional LysR family regulator
MFDFNKLYNFMIVAESQGVTDAAKKLRRTQSAISQQIDALEDELELQLLERRGGRVYLTREGKSLHSSLRGLFIQMEEKIRDIQGRLKDVEGRIRVGVTPSVCDHLLLPVITKFQGTHPKVFFDLVLNPDEELETKLRDDIIDCAFIIEFRERHRFDVYEFAQFQEMPICSKNYLERWAKSVSEKKIGFDSLKNASLIDFGEDLPNIKHWLKKNTKNWQSITEDLTSKYVIENYSSVKLLVSQSIGIATLPLYMVQSELKDGSLVAPFPYAKPTLVGLDFAMRPSKNVSLPLKAFKTFLQLKDTT